MAAAIGLAFAAPSWAVPPTCDVGRVVTMDALDLEADPFELLEVDVLATVLRGQCLDWSEGSLCP